MAPERILIINCAGIGDIILSSPALRALKYQYPHSELYLLTYAGNRELVERCPYVKDTFYFGHALSLHTLRTLAALRRMRFDTVINLYNIRTVRGMCRVWALLWILNPRCSIGRNTGGRGFFYTLSVNEAPGFTRHDTDVMLEVASRTGARDDNAGTELWLHPDDGRADAFLREHGIAPGRVVIGMHPGARRASHRWPASSFIAIARCLADYYNAVVVVTGGYRERRYVQRICAAVGPRAIDASGLFSLAELAGFLKRYSVFIANDTGPIHIAGALGVSTVVIAGSSPPAFFPRGSDAVTVLTDAGRDGSRGLKAISCDEVIEAAHALINQTKPVPATCEIR